MSNNKKKTIVLIVLDRSGSMQTVAEEALANFNDQIRLAKKNADEQDIRICLVTFNDEVYEHFWLQPASECETAVQGDYVCVGWTAYYDALGYGIEKLQETTDQNDPDTAYMIYAITDGNENRSSHFDGTRLFEKIATLQQTGKWTFSFMCSSHSQMQEIQSATGVSKGNFAVWSNSTRGRARRAYAENAVRTAAFYTARSEGKSAVDNFYSDDAALCADYSGGAADADAALRSFGGMRCCARGVTACAMPDDGAEAFVPDTSGTAKVFTSGKSVSWKK